MSTLSHLATELGAQSDTVARGGGRWVWKQGEEVGGEEGEEGEDGEDREDREGEERRRRRGRGRGGGKRKGREEVKEEQDENLAPPCNFS